MDDRMTQHQAPAAGTPQSSTPSDAVPRSLSEILQELALISSAQQGETTAMRGAVSELSRALARLFEMIRTDRAEQRERIEELQRELVTAHLRLADLEARGVGDSVVADPAVAEPVATPDPSDFDQLRAAAERLRMRTEQLVSESRAADGQAPPADDVHEDEPEDGTAEADTAVAEDAGNGLAARADEPQAFGRPGILRVFPGAMMQREDDAALDVESELELDDRGLQAAVAQLPVAREHHAEALGVESELDSLSEDAAGDESDESRSSAAEPDGAANTPPAPVEVEPRPARKRRAGLRRRRIDARKLQGVEPAVALRAMVGAVDEVWTAGCRVDLMVALIDGGALHVSGGDTEPLQVADVSPGTAARATVTATSAQLVPLFGRLELTDDQSPPLIHGARRDADLLVGWIDRAQRLAVEPL